MNNFIKLTIKREDKSGMFRSVLLAKDKVTCVEEISSDYCEVTFMVDMSTYTAFNVTETLDEIYRMLEN